MTDTLLFPGVYAKASPEKTAVIMAGSGETMSYGELDAYANKLARHFAKLGFEYGDHIAILVDNRLECPAIQWGAHYAGLYYTFISNRLTASEVAYIVEDCGAKAFIACSSTIELAQAACEEMSTSPLLYSVDAAADVENLEDVLVGYSTDPLEGAKEGSEMLYSSGTTGRPKGVKPVLTDLPLGSTYTVAGLMKMGFGVSDASVYLSPAPYYHAAPMKWCQGTLALGGTVVMLEKFDAEKILAAIDQYSVSHAQFVPTMFTRLLALPEAVKEKYDISSLKVAVHAAAPCPVPVKEAMLNWWGDIIAEYYSCTEGIGMTLVTSAQWREHPGTVGKALLGEVHILNEAGEELPAGEDGTVYFANGAPFVYHNDEAKTAEAYNGQGWASVGDIGHVDADGFLYLTDRKSNMIISGGVNVYPQETENVLIAHPKVMDAAVIGTPHADFGEEVRAVVQLEQGIEPTEALAEELIAYCREQLSAIKSPRVVDFRESLPREPNGKLLKRLLRDEYRAKLSA